MGLQTFTVEYRVSGQLDGVTPSPPLSDATVLSNGIYQFEVSDLGLIDPSYDGEIGSMGDRFMTNLIIKSPNAPVGGDVSLVADGLVYDIIDQPTTTLSQFVNCVPIPQGSLVKLTGFDAGVSPTPIVVRMQFRAAEDGSSYALLIDSCCCCTSPPVIESLSWTSSPACIDCEGLEADRTVTITGTGFTPSTSVSVSNASAEGLCQFSTVVISDVTIVSSTEITFVVTCGGTTPLDCPFDVMVTNSPGCASEFSSAFCTTSSI
jgi:hypothetical protein